MTKTRLQPTFDRVLIERQPTETKVGSIVIPENSQSKPNQGTIRDVGPGVMTKAKHAQIYSDLPSLGFDDQTFEIGDKVMIMQYAGIEVEIDGRQFTLLKQDEIITKIIEFDDDQPSSGREHA